MTQDDYTLYRPSKEDHPEIIAVWEASVRATHHFLREEDIVYYRGMMAKQYLDMVSLYCANADGHIIGFMGLSGSAIEMLFIDPKARGQGVGKYLLRYAVEEMGADTVDVNEQNEQAAGFYKKMGFVATGWSEFDGAGKPYPLLHMKLADHI
jgi:putative acetyltransferase